MFSQSEKSLIANLIQRLEGATRPDRQIDLDFAYLRGWIPHQVLPGTTEPTLKNGLPIPFYTADEHASEDQLRKDLPSATIKISTGWAIDVWAWSDEDVFRSGFFSSAWAERDGSFHMEKPPANVAIALLLVNLREFAKLAE